MVCQWEHNHTERYENLSKRREIDVDCNENQKDFSVENDELIWDWFLRVSSKQKSISFEVLLFKQFFLVLVEEMEQLHRTKNAPHQ